VSLRNMGAWVFGCLAFGCSSPLCPSGTVAGAGGACAAPVDASAMGDAALCADGWDHDGDPATACVAWATCEPGTSVREEGTASTNRTCTPCDEGTFTSARNQSRCLPHRECGVNGSELAPGSATSDRACIRYRVWGTRDDDRLADMVVTPDGTIVFAGSQQAAATGGTLPPARTAVVALGMDGIERWNASPASTTPKALTAVQDGAVMLVGSASAALPGRTFGGATDSFALTYDALGTIVRTLEWGGTVPETSLDAVCDVDGACTVVGGAVTGNGTYDGTIVRIASGGNFLWTKSFGTEQNEQAVSVARRADGFCFAGYTSGNFAGPVQGLTDAFVRCVDASGEELWTRTIASNGLDYGIGVLTRVDGSVILVSQVGGVLADYTTDMSVASLLRTYSASGEELGTLAFTRQSPGGRSLPRAWALDSAEHVWLALQDAGDTCETSLVELDTEGNELTRYEMPPGRSMCIRAIVEHEGMLVLGGQYDRKEELLAAPPIGRDDILIAVIER
jgi:TNFR/NGFR cysteine-rich region